MARPTIFTKELADRLCAVIAGGASLRKACRRAGMPDKATALRWAQDRMEFCDQLARAYEVRGEHLVEDGVDQALKLERAVRDSDLEARALLTEEKLIEPDPTAEGGVSISAIRTVKALRGHGRYVSPERVRATQLLIDTLFKRAAQLAPKKLGPLVRHAGEDGGALPLIIRRERPAGDS